jgi:hypothetical protein
MVLEVQNGVILVHYQRGGVNFSTESYCSTLLGLREMLWNYTVGSDTYIGYARMGRLRNANQYVSNQTAAVAGANTSITLVGNLGCTDHGSCTSWYLMEI